MKKILISFLVVGIVVVSVSASGVASSQVASVGDGFGSLVDIFKLKYSEESLALVMIPRNLAQSVRFRSVALATTTFPLNGPGVPYYLTITNSRSPLSGVILQGRIEQSKTKVQMGSSLILCNGSSTPGLLPSGTCQTTFSMTTASSSPANSLKDGRAIAVVELRYGNTIVARRSTPVKLVGSQTSSMITVAKSIDLGTPTYINGQVSVKIGSYVLAASAAEGVNLNTMSVMTASGGGPSPFANLRLRVGATQFGVTQPTVVASTTYNFSGTLSVPAGGAKVVDIYADILSSASQRLYPAVSVFVGCSGAGAVRLNPVSCNSVGGQDIRIGGQTALQVTLDSASPAANQLVMGSTGNSLATFRFTETSNIEEIKVTDLYILDKVSSVASVRQGFSNLSLYSGATLLAQQVGPAVVDGNAYGYQFSFATPLFVPKSGSVSLILKGDVASYDGGGATDNSQHTFTIATSTNPSRNTPGEVVVALGRTSNTTSSITISNARGNTMTVLRTRLSVVGSALGTISGRAKTSIDDIGTLSFTADAAGPVLLGQVAVTYSGTAPSGTAFYGSNSVVLYDPETGTTYSRTSNTGSKIVYNMNDYVISAGATKTFRVRLNSNPVSGGGTTANPQSGISQSLSATINAGGDVTYKTAISGGTLVSLPTAGLYAPPIVITNVTYAQGT